MSQTFLQKSDELKKIFSALPSLDARYSAIIDLGKKLPIYPQELKTADRIVTGCQSILYLDASLKDQKIYFQIYSEALISAGLAALLIYVYSGESPQTLLSCPPQFLAELGIIHHLSSNRSNGLAQIHLRMKQVAIYFLKKM